MNRPLPTPSSSRVRLVGPAAPRRALAAVLLVVSAPLVPSASAQPCFGPDNLSGGCCQIVTPTLPVFPAFQLPGLGVCWQNCQPNLQNTLKINVQTPIQTGCTEWVAPMDVVDGSSGLPAMNGKLVLDYTRTWEEMDPSGAFHQVWRFAAKADLAPALVGIVPPCPTPGCLPPFGGEPTAFFYGYVDYAAPCSGSGAPTENAMVLYHACDFFIHRPGLSSAPGVYHPAESYGIVAPVSTAQPFVLNATPPSGGPLIGEGTRLAPGILPPICLATDPIVQGQMVPLGGVCPCPPSGNPPQHQLRRFDAQTACPDPTGLPGGFQALNIGFPNLLPWFYLTTTNIGRWTNGA
ncbi:MAG: hypothetical protein ACF8XB_10970, partial [Planctomycetota bacterium JB042]